MKANWAKSIVLLCLAVGALVACSKLTENPLVESEWTLESLNGKDLIPGTQITATFNGREIAGFAGCNLYSMAVEIKDGSLVFDKNTTAMTDQGCRDPEGTMEQEQVYVTTLISITTYLLSDEKLEMENEGGDVLLSYKKGLPEGFPD